MSPVPVSSFVLIALLFATTSTTAVAAEATVNIDVPSNRWKTVRLKNLPRGSSVSLQIIASDKIRVIVVDSTELKRFPKTRALFEATVDKRLGFSVVIPRTGDYYVVFDNRTQSDPRQITLRVKAEPPARERSSPNSNKKLDET